jgi:hypothetical protein
MKRVLIKSIEIRDDRFPELYTIVKELQDRGEDIPKLIRGLLFREYLPEMLSLSGAPVENTLQAIASLRRNLTVTMTDLDFAEMRCKQLMGVDVGAESSVKAKTVKPNKPVSEDEPEGAEQIADSW